jgi:hypothetical protein
LVSASFTFATPLAAGLNFADESASLLNWTVTDGVNTLSEGGGDYLAALDLSTDSAGVIGPWNFLAESAPFTPSGQPPDWLDIGSQNTGFITDLSEFWVTQTDPSWIATISNDPGTWNVTVVTMPEPSTTVSSCLATAMLLFAMRRRRSS